MAVVGSSLGASISLAGASCRCVVSSRNPKPEDIAKAGDLWIVENGDIFVCIEKTDKGTKWKSCCSSKIIAPINYTTVDVFEDGSCIALYRFEGNVDSDSGKWNGVPHGNIQYVEGVHGQAVELNAQNGYLDFDFDTVPRVLTVSMWVKAPRRNHTIIKFFDSNGKVAGLYYWGGDNNPSLGLNTWNSDCYGVHYSLDDWAHIVAVFNFDQLKESFRLYINGEKQPLSQVRNSPKHNAIGEISRITTNDGYNDSQSFKGEIDNLRFFNRMLTDDEVAQLYEIGG